MKFLFVSASFWFDFVGRLLNLVRYAIWSRRAKTFNSLIVTETSQPKAYKQERVSVRDLQASSVGIRRN